MAFGYEIEKGNVVVIWADEKGTPGNVVMETWPDGTKWKDKAEAEAWAKAFIAAAEDSTKPVPGNSPDKKTLAASDLEEYTAEQLAEIATNHEAQLAAEAKAAEEAAAAIEAERQAEIQAMAEADAENPKDISDLPDANHLEEIADEDIIEAEVVEEPKPVTKKK
jgi:hypothetical protein